MIIKNYLNKIVIVGALGMAFLTQPAHAYVSQLGPGFELPAVGIVALGATHTIYPLQKNVEVAPPDDGAEVVISSVPVVIRTQVSKNIFTANIPNDKGGYSTVIIQKLGDRFMEIPGELYPNFLMVR